MPFAFNPLGSTKIVPNIKRNHFLSKILPSIAQNLHAPPLSCCPPDKFQIKAKEKKCANLLQTGSTCTLRKCSWRSKKCFGRTDVDSQPYDRPLSHLDLIFHFHKYFSPVAKKYLFEVKQILLTDLFVSHLAAFEFDTMTQMQRAGWY